MPRILIIDDDEQVRKALRFQLSDEYEIVDSGTPEEALALALQHKPDAILLDLSMPGYSGYEILQTLSSLSFTQQIPILIVSGEPAAYYKEFCENLGAKGYFQKPVEIDALRQTLSTLANGDRPKAGAEPRFRLRVLLKLKGIDAAGAPFELLTATDTVGVSGFACACNASVKEDSAVEVYLAKHAQKIIGRARVIRVEWPNTPGQRCEMRFVEKPIDWVLH